MNFYMYLFTENAFSDDNGRSVNFTVPFLPNSEEQKSIDSEIQEKLAKRSSKMPKRHPYMRIAKQATQDDFEFGECFFNPNRP